MENITIHSPTIQLDQFLKWAGVADSGGQVKTWVDAGLILVNNEIATERRKKIQPNDIVEVTGLGAWKVIGP
ncbi:MAG: RNA-binding S4 domain-containing protein [Negativicutes bacterium]|nr:RNA-binding S4 domain-containing protein [Negativicutes bacterium]